LINNSIFSPQGIQSLEPFDLPSNAPLRDINRLLSERALGRAAPIADANAATHVIRAALGGADHARVSRMLALPLAVARQYRDDVSVSVVHFDPKVGRCLDVSRGRVVSDFGLLGLNF
jgi:hypothetical protein